MRAIKFPTTLSLRWKLLLISFGVGASLLVATMANRQTAVVQRIDSMFFDAYAQHSASGAVASHTAVIDIDDSSLDAVGQWPWPRYRVAALIEAIAAAKPAGIGVDVLFSEPDRASLGTIQRTFKHDFGLDIEFEGVPTALLDNDGYLGSMLSSIGAVTAEYFFFDHATTGAGPDPGVRFNGSLGSVSLNKAQGVLANTPAIASRARSSGFINNQPDHDGVVRRLPLLIDHQATVHPSLALSTVMAALGVSSASIEKGRNSPVIHVGEHRIPIDERGFSLLRLNGGPRLYPTLSAVDVLSGRVNGSDMRGKIVFVGSSAVGLHDLHRTTSDARFPGVTLHAAMAESILSDDFLESPGWASAAITTECLAVGILTALLFALATGPLLLTFGTALIAATPVVAGLLAFSGAGWFVSPGAPVLLAAVLFVVFSTARFAIDKRAADAWFKRLENARQVTIESMAMVAETRDPETGAHIKRTQHYVKAIAEELKRSGHHAKLLTGPYIHLLFISAPLHDIGKVGVPDHILLKPGRLTPDEYELMKEHAEFGRKIIFSTAQNIDGDNFLSIAGEIAATHHEKWDGTGYPLGLAGDRIPLSGRIMAIADIYDALISRRCYKEPFPHATATGLMREASGTTFDPVALDAFFRIEEHIKGIAAQYRDDAESTLPEPTQFKLTRTARDATVERAAGACGPPASTTSH